MLIKALLLVISLWSWNVHNGVGLDGRRDAERIGAEIRRAGADIVAVQEVDSLTTRSGGRYVLADIAAEAGLRPLFAPAINFDGGRYGIGLLVKDEPLSIKRLPLPGREEARVMIVAEFPDYVVGCTHFSLTEADALESARIVCEEAARWQKPFILAGDFNSRPDSPVIEALREHFEIPGSDSDLTFPADEPNERIDYMMISRDSEARADSVSVVNLTVESDHRPLRAVITIPGT